MKRRTVLALAAALGLGGALVPGTASAVGPTVVVSGLNNPRQLAWDDHGRLLVAEAGRGTLDPKPGSCLQGPEGEVCVGVTGSISRVSDPAHTKNAAPRRVVTGLISAATRDGGQATGPDGVTFQNGRILAQETWAPPDQMPRGVPKWQLGKLLKALGDGSKRAIADVAAVELTQNPDGTDVNPNPYAALALDSKRTVVADAGGNHLVLVKDGKTKVFTVLPGHGCGGAPTPECDQHSVPTSLTRGPGGALYVGELAHFEPGEARVWKVSPTSGRLLGWYGKGGTICSSDTTGFSTITGVAFGPDGSLYVSELFGGDGGQVVKVTPDCERSVQAVPAPAGLVTDKRGNVFVSAFSISDSDGAGGAPPGQVWRLRF